MLCALTIPLGGCSASDEPDDNGVSGEEGAQIIVRLNEEAGWNDLEKGGTRADATPKTDAEKKINKLYGVVYKDNFNMQQFYTTIELIKSGDDWILPLLTSGSYYLYLVANPGTELTTSLINHKPNMLPNNNLFKFVCSESADLEKRGASNGMLMVTKNPAYFTFNLSGSDVNVSDATLSHVAARIDVVNTRTDCTITKLVVKNNVKKTALITTMTASEYGSDYMEDTEWSGSPLVAAATSSNPTPTKSIYVYENANAANKIQFEMTVQTSSGAKTLTAEMFTDAGKQTSFIFERDKRYILEVTDQQVEVKLAGTSNSQWGSTTDSSIDLTSN